MFGVETPLCFSRTSAREAALFQLFWFVGLAATGCGGDDPSALGSTSGVDVATTLGTTMTTGGAAATTASVAPTTGQGDPTSGTQAGTSGGAAGTAQGGGSTTTAQPVSEGGVGTSTSGAIANTSSSVGPDAAVDPDAMAGTDDSAAPLPSSGCMGGSIVAGESEATLQVGSNRREYVMTVPPSYDGTEPYAVLLDFHGGTYDGPRWHARASNKFPDMAETERFLYVTPTGEGEWWTTTDGKDGDDGQFMRALIDELKSTACIDTRRIYATGCSMGGDMSFYMGCYFSEDIAAVMPMCGSSAFDLESECKPTRPISMQFVIGSEDSLNCWEPPRTFVGNPCATEVFEVFQGLDGCTGTPKDKHGGKCQSYDQCAEGTEVSICMFEAEHTTLYTSSDIEIYQETWDFLSRFYIH